MNVDDKIITVTSPLLPDLKDFKKYLEDIWDRKWLTNNGHYHQELDLRKSFLLTLVFLTFLFLLMVLYH